MWSQPAAGDVNKNNNPPPPPPWEKSKALPRSWGHKAGLKPGDGLTGSAAFDFIVMMEGHAARHVPVLCFLGELVLSNILPEEGDAE